MAIRNRQAAIIRQNASENTMLSVPMITIDMTNFEPDRERLQNPNHVDTVKVTERYRDPVTGEYGSQKGNSISVERLMPRPFTMTMQVDIWTSTLDQKHQLLEQIDTMMFPSFDIQNSDNPLDWSALTTATFESQQWTSISIPVGAEDEIDVATLTFKLPIWLNPPALMTKNVVIEQINTNISQITLDEQGNPQGGDPMMTVVTTPENHSVMVKRGLVTLLGGKGSETDQSGNPYSWEALIAQYGGQFHPAETTLALRSSLEDDAEIIGTLQATSESNVLMWQPDPRTLPQNTLLGVNAIINPLYSHPQDGNLPSAQEGQRYLLKGDMAGPSLAWGSISARDGSIIKYHNNEWVVDFDSSTPHGIEYVLNEMTGSQLKWDTDLSEWVMAIDGVYQAGYWKLGL